MFLKQASTHIAVETERKILVHILDTLSDIVCGKQKKNYQRATKFILDYTLLESIPGVPQKTGHSLISCNVKAIKANAMR
jgi:hypothetical protein